MEIVETIELIGNLEIKYSPHWRSRTTISLETRKKNQHIEEIIPPTYKLLRQQDLANLGFGSLPHPQKSIATWQ